MIRTATVILLVYLVGCTPIFKNFNSYSPPSSATGIRCVSKCDENKLSCATQLNLQFGNCKSQQSSYISACEGQKANQKAAYLAANPGPNSELFYADSRSCELEAPSCTKGDDQECENLYALCYKNCGGTVTSSSRCIRYCDNLPSSSPQATQDVAAITPSESKSQTMEEYKNRLEYKGYLMAQKPSKQQKQLLEENNQKLIELQQRL